MLFEPICLCLQVTSPLEVRLLCLPEISKTFENRGVCRQRRSLHSFNSVRIVNQRSVTRMHSLSSQVTTHERLRALQWLASLIFLWVKVLSTARLRARSLSPNSFLKSGLCDSRALRYLEIKYLALTRHFGSWPQQSWTKASRWGKRWGIIILWRFVVNSLKLLAICMLCPLTACLLKFPHLGYLN